MKVSLRWYGPDHAGDRAHLDGGIGHGHQEHRETVLLPAGPGGPREEEAPLGDGRVRGPDLLARHPPAIAIADGGRPQRGEVRAGIRLAEALAPDHLAPRDGRQMLALLLRCPVAHDHRAHPVDPHVLSAPRLVMRPHLLAHRGLLPDRGIPAAPALRPGHAQQAAVGENAAEPLRRLQIRRIVGEGTEEIRRDVLLHQLAQPGPQRHHVLAHVEVHVSPSGRSSRHQARSSGPSCTGRRHSPATAPRLRSRRRCRPSAAACCASASDGCARPHTWSR